MLIRTEKEGMNQMDLLAKVVKQDKEVSVLVPDIRKFVKNLKKDYDLDVTFRLKTTGKLSTITHVQGEDGEPIRVYPYDIILNES